MVPLRAAVALTCAALALAPAPASASGQAGTAEAGAVLRRWFDAQERLDAWSATFTQTRHLQALTRPLTNTGRVWFGAPDRFRWELGEPPRSVAVRNGDTMILLTPRLKRAEVHRLSAVPPGPLREALSLLDTGFPRDPAAFRERFEVTAVEENPDAVTLRLVPRDPDTRRFLPLLVLTLHPDTLDLRSTELTLADGSRVHTAFRDPVRNPTIESDRFDVSVPPGFQVSGGTDAP